MSSKKRTQRDYPLYRENPDLDLTVVKKFNGDLEYRENCRYIKGEYYCNGMDGFYVEGDPDNWYRITSPKIEKDWSKNEWILKDTREMITGIVEFNGNIPIMGNFSKDIYNNCICHVGNNKQHALNPELLIANGFFESLQDSTFYKRTQFSDSDYRKMITPTAIQTYGNRGYNIEDNGKDFQLMKESYKNYPIKISKGAVKFAKFLGEITWGNEAESSVGALPKYVHNRYGVVACRDGSIPNMEFVTVPMQGAKGLQSMKELFNEYQKRIKVDISCAYHIHIGTIPLEREYIVALYKLCYEIQDDIFHMFPYYKTDHRNIKRKNYCQKLKKMSIYSLKDDTKEGYTQYIDTVYNKIYSWLSDGIDVNEQNNRRVLRHPITHKWERPSRYAWCNLENMMFSPRGTAEFRVHSATANPYRAINWLFMCTAIIKFAEKNIRTILSSEKITFIDVLNYYRDTFKNNKDAAFLSEYLINYYEERCAKFKKDFEKGDFISEWELKQDSQYTYKYKGVSDLF